MNADKYKQILIHHGIPSGNRLIGDNFVFQHDNDSKYTSNVLKTYLQRRAESGTQICRIAPLKVLTLTSSKLDEIIWTGRKTTKIKTQIMGNITECMEQPPNGISPEIAGKRSKWISAVLHEKGGHSKYLNCMH